MVTPNLGSIRNASAEDDQTARWIAPEILDGEPYSKEADIFSLAGVTIEVRCNHWCSRMGNDDVTFV